MCVREEETWREKSIVLGTLFWGHENEKKGKGKKAEGDDGTVCFVSLNYILF